MEIGLPPYVPNRELAQSNSPATVDIMSIYPNDRPPIYLGDAVYAAIEHGMIKLMTGSHDHPDNTVYLEPEVWSHLLRWVNGPEQPPNDIWQDPMVREALKERPATDIWVLRCPECARLSYYNQGSTFTCRFCLVSWYCLSEGEFKPEGIKSLWINEADLMTLADTVTDPTDGYHNETR